MKMFVYAMISFGVVCGALSGCSSAHDDGFYENHATETNDIRAFCQDVTAGIAALYAIVPDSHHVSRYKADRNGHVSFISEAGYEAGQKDSPNVIDLAHITSLYEVIYQHKGAEAVYEYCLERHKL